MSQINRIVLRVYCTSRAHLVCHKRDDRGQATAEYGVVLLVAAALGLAVLRLFMGGSFDGILKTLVSTALNAATKLVKA